MDKESLLDQLCEKYPELTGLKNRIDESTEMVIRCLSNEGKLLICGNGGSSSAAEHMVAEMMKNFEICRPLDKSFKKRLSEISPERGKYLSEKLQHGLPAISLSAHTSLTTAISNDTDADLVFAQQLIGYGCENDILIAVTTSGNSQNILDACLTAKAMNINIIGITGKSGGKIKKYCDILINIPEDRTALVQELQLPVQHTICRIVENYFYGSST
jgi:phosphoheptose isomerase